MFAQSWHFVKTLLLHGMIDTWKYELLVWHWSKNVSYVSYDNYLEIYEITNHHVQIYEEGLFDLFLI